MGRNEGEAGVSDRTQHNGAPAVFLDLNGTLVEPVQPTTLDEYTLLPRAIAAVQLLNSIGFRVMHTFDDEGAGIT